MRNNYFVREVYNHMNCYAIKKQKNQELEQYRVQYFLCIIILFNKISYI